jgi:putative transcriptional regulator
MTTITNHLRRLRLEHGELTQEALAQKCGVTRQTIISLESGKYMPSLELAFKLAHAFGVKIEDVFVWQPKVARPLDTKDTNNA